MNTLISKLVRLIKRRVFTSNLYYSLGLLRRAPYVRRKQAEAWGDKKGTLRILADLLVILWRDHGHIQAYYTKVKGMVDDYFVMRMYLRDRSVNDYVLDFVSLYIMHFAAGENRSHYNVIDDKHSFWDYMHERGFPVTGRLGNIVVQPGAQPLWEQPGGGTLPVTELLKRYPQVFCKPADGTQGKLCGKWEWIDDGTLSFNNRVCPYGELRQLVQHNLLVEEVLVNHPDIARFHPASCNTLRLITLCKPGGEDLRLHFACLRMGVGNGQTDNFSNSGIGVRIMPDGRLAELGWFRDSRLGPVAEHPDSHIVFKDCCIPMWNECVELVLKAHEVMKDKICGVGWDIVVTEQGPLILEANPYFGIGLPQSAGLGFRKILFRDYLPTAMKYAKAVHFPL